LHNHQGSLCQSINFVGSQVDSFIDFFIEKNHVVCAPIVINEFLESCSCVSIYNHCTFIAVALPSIKLMLATNQNNKYRFRSKEFGLLVQFWLLYVVYDELRVLFPD